jgi:hypothetical protein
MPAPDNGPGDGWIALIHEVESGETVRYYRPRFVWLDEANALRGISRAFFFNENNRSEYAAGLAWHPDGERVLVSWGDGDGEAWIATVEAAEVCATLEDTALLPSGAPAANAIAGARPVVPAQLVPGDASGAGVHEPHRGGRPGPQLSLG